MSEGTPVTKEEMLELRDQMVALVQDGFAARNEPTALAIAQPGQIAPHEMSASMAAAQAKAQVEARFLVALGRPRNRDVARIALLKDCRRTDFAEVAIFTRPVGGEKPIRGPSIRFAESAARAWGNIDVDARTIYDSPQKRLMAVKVTDLESNVTYGVEITINRTVERRTLKKGQAAISSRTNSTGHTVYLVEATEDDLLAKGNSLVSKAIRTQILRLLPGDLVAEARKVCEQTMAASDRTDPDAARKRILDSFAEMNVPVREIEELLGHDVGTASPQEIAYLRGVYTLIREGEGSWSEVIAISREDRKGKPTSEGDRTTSLKQAIANRAKTGNGNGKPPAEPAAEPAAEKPKRRKRRTKAEIEAARAQEAATPPAADPPAEPPPPEPPAEPEYTNGEVPPEDEPTDEELGRSRQEETPEPAEPPPLPNCPECGKPMSRFNDEYAHCEEGCDRWEKLGE